MISLSKGAKRWVKILALVFAVVFVGALVTTLLIRDSHKDDADNSDNQSKNTIDTQLKQKIETLENDGDYDKASQLIEAQIRVATGDQEKSDLYFRWSILAENSNDLEKAVEYAEKSYELNKTYGTASRLAQAYTTSGDTDKAKQYWNEAIGLLDKDSPDYELMKGRAQSALDSL